MPDQSGETPKRVPKRSDTEKNGLYRNSRATELANTNGDFVYQHFSQDPKSPGFIGKKLATHEYGPPNGWKQQIGPWEVVNSQTDKDVRALDARTDQGKPVDGTMRYGEQITCRIPRSEWLKYGQVDAANGKERERQLMSPDSIVGSQTSTTSVVLDGDQDAMHRQRALINAGHPMPAGGLRT